MKIELTHPITHDDLTYGRGVHAFPDKLANQFLKDAPHAAFEWVPGKNDVGPGSVSLPGQPSKVEIQDRILARIGALKDRRRRLQELGIPVDEIDSETGVLQWQVRCVQCGNTSDKTLADHLSELDRQKVTERTSPVEVQPERLVLSGSTPPDTRQEKTALPPKLQDLSSYF